MNRKMRYYLRGLGLGIFLTTLILSLVGIRQKNMTDEEIMARARELGMVTASEISLSTIGNTSTGIGTIVNPEETGESSQEEAQSEEAESGAEESQGSEETAETPETAEETEMVQEAENPETEETTVATEETESTESTDSTESTESTETTESTESTETTENTESTETAETTTEETPVEETPAVTEEPVAQETDSEEGTTETPSETDQTVTITVSRGSGSETVARSCAKAGLVESASEFDKYLIDNGYSKSIRVGTFEIPMGADLQTIAKILTSKN